MRRFEWISPLRLTGRPGCASPVCLIALLVGVALGSAGCGSGKNGGASSQNDSEGNSHEDRSAEDLPGNDNDNEANSLTRLEVDRLLEAAQLDLDQLRLREAEDKLRRVMAAMQARTSEDPQTHQILLTCHHDLASILNRQGRRWEAESLLFNLLRSGVITAQQLVMLGNRLEIIHDPDFTNTALNAVPDDPMMLLNVAKEHRTMNRIPESLGFLDQVLAVYPTQVEAMALKGVLLSEQGSPDDFLAWNASLPEACESHPDVWVARGLFARTANDRTGALRCFWEAFRRDPNSQLACYQIGMLLTDEGEVDDAAPFLERADNLNALHYALHPMFEEGASERLVTTAAEMCEQLGRFWEAWGWYSLMVTFQYNEDWAKEKQTQMNLILQSENPPRIHPAVLEFDRSTVADRSMPDWDALARRVQGRTTDQGVFLEFNDVAHKVGIDFQYYASPDESTEGVRMFETTGGGVAAIDFDLDGWTDLYWTQGAPWPVDSMQRDYIDRIYKNVSGQRMLDVTDATGLGDADFSQGVTVGDVNNDGFPDLYVANIGENVLYLNQGDGTFMPMPFGVFGDRKVWTTSCLIADLNCDGFPDIYNANYLGGEDIHERICGAGVPRACSPSIFDGEHDQLFLSRGDGTWQDASEAVGISTLGGKGMGLIAARFDESQKLSVFVANDAVANNFLVDRTDDDSPLMYDDIAMANGLAFDRDGRFQACMGVAFDDFNRDGLYEMFVTNYYNDSNTLYSQRPGLLFDVMTRETGLRDPSFLQLGFGTQFIDVENDGLPDLVVTNGHIDDYTHEGAPYFMVPQLFRNQNDQFIEATGKMSGTYFREKYRGRGLAVLDWNRDGREDFAVSHLDAPVSLVENDTQQTGHFARVRCIGTDGSRIPIGVEVRITTDLFERSRQLSAGSGYHAHNESVLAFGLGEATRIRQLSIRWPSNHEEVFEDLPVDCEITIVEGGIMVIDSMVAGVDGDENGQ